MARWRPRPSCPWARRARSRPCCRNPCAATGAEILLGNTYHLMLRPGAERVAALGGLHKFMNWPRPILTDSGGFQVMSLSELRKIGEKGVEFRSHLDGSRHLLTPERSIEIQHLLDADITMCFDECTPFPATPEEAANSMRLSMRWAERCRTAFQAARGLSAVRHHAGRDLSRSCAGSRRRRWPASASTAMPSAGLRSARASRRCSAFWISPRRCCRPSAPRYLMGVGRPEDILGAVTRGIDMFDCVMPTRAGRTGAAFTRFGELNMRNARHAEDPAPHRSRLRLPGLPRLFPRLYPSPREVEGDPGLDAVDLAQPALLSGADGRPARGDRGR